MDNKKIEIGIFIAAILAISVFAIVVPASAAQVIGYSVQSDGDDQLYRIDLTTGTATPVGPVGFADVQALSFDANGVLYGIDDITEQLITIDLTTGAGTAVGSLWGSTGNMWDMGLTFDPSGNLWMSTDEPVPHNFYSINPTTGVATLVGAQGQPVTGLASFTDGTIYGLGGHSGATGRTDNLVTINTATGVATSVGPLVTVSLKEGGLEFDSSGTLWGIEDGGTIFTINPLTGQATVVATTLSGFEGLAITGPPARVPALTPTGLIALVGLLSVVAAISIRTNIRKRR